MSTKVIFLYEKGTKDIFAFFPEEQHDKEFKLCYTPYEGHVPCSVEYAKECEEATVSDILPLHSYLTRIGYEVETTKKTYFFTR